MVGEGAVTEDEQAADARMIPNEESKCDNIAKFEEVVDFENVDSSERSSVRPPRLAPSEATRSRPGTANKRTHPDRYGNLIAAVSVPDLKSGERHSTAKNPPSNKTSYR